MVSVKSKYGNGSLTSSIFSEVIIWDMGSKVNKPLGEVEVVTSLLFMVGDIADFKI